MLQSPVNSAEGFCRVLHTSGMLCVVQQIFGSSGKDPIFCKDLDLWIFEYFSYVKKEVFQLYFK